MSRISSFVLWMTIIKNQQKQLGSAAPLPEHEQIEVACQGEAKDEMDIPPLFMFPLSISSHIQSA
jgi:hypothetical protein